MTQDKKLNKIANIVRYTYQPIKLKKKPIIFINYDVEKYAHFVQKKSLEKR